MITLGQLSVGRPLTTWFNYRPGIYYYNFDGTYPLIDSDFLVDVPTIPGVTAVGSVFSDSTQLTESDSIANLDVQPSFYYDQPNNMVYIRLQNYDPPDIHQVSGGPIYGFSNEPYIDPVAATEYESRLVSSSNVTRNKDALFFGTITYSDFDVEIKNADGALYDIQNWDIYGQPVTLLYGDKSQAASSFTAIKTGRVKEYKFSGSTLSITVQDSRRVLSKTLPVRTVTGSAGVDRDKNKSIPVVYGTCRRVPARVTNDVTGTTSFNFIVADCVDHADGIEAIDAVYVDGVSVTPTASSLTAGTFSLSSSDYEIGQAVTVDLRGYVDGSGDLIDNPLDILKDIFTVYLELAYSSLNYDIVAWESATVGQPACSYAAHESESIAKIAEAFGASTLAGISITPEGKFTWLEHDDDDPPLLQITDEDWLDLPSIEFSSDEALSSATVNYGRDWNTGDFRLSVYDAGYDDFLLKFKRPKDESFNTVLSSETDADDFSTELGTSYGDIQILIEGSISLSLTNPSDIKTLLAMNPGENVDASVKNIEIVDGKVFRALDTISRFKGELLELTINADSETADIKLRYIEDYDIVIVDGSPLGEFVIGDSFLSESGVIDV